MELHQYTDEKLFKLITEGNVKAFEYLFKSNYDTLYRYSAKITSDAFVAEEIVQDIFVSLWQKRNTIVLSGSFTGYLYKAVKNKSIDHLKAKYTQLQKTFIADTEAQDKSAEPIQDLEAQDLEAAIHQAIEKLPNKCKEIFLLSREAGLTYDEIAQTLSISSKTVKAQMGIALKKLREFLKNYKFIMLLISTLCFFRNILK